MAQAFAAPLRIRTSHWPRKIPDIQRMRIFFFVLLVGKPLHTFPEALVHAMNSGKTGGESGSARIYHAHENTPKKLSPTFGAARYGGHPNHRRGRCSRRSVTRLGRRPGCCSQQHRPPFSRKFGGSAQTPDSHCDECGDSEVRFTLSAGSASGLQNPSHTRIEGLLVSFRARSSCGMRDDMKRTSRTGHVVRHPKSKDWEYAANPAPPRSSRRRCGVNWRGRKNALRSRRFLPGAADSRPR